MLDNLEPILEFIEKSKIAPWTSFFVGIIIGVFLFHLFFEKKTINNKTLKGIIASVFGFVFIFFVDKNYYFIGAFLGFLLHYLDFRWNVWLWSKGKISDNMFNSSTQCIKAIEEATDDEEEEEENTNKK
jgi:hypothetical protein